MRMTPVQSAGGWRLCWAICRVRKSWASSYRAIEFLVGQEKLAQNDGLLGDILLTTQLVTEAIGIVDPTGASDAVNAVVCLAQGDKAGAAMAVASIAVPIGADKLIKHAQKVPTGLVAKAKNHVVDFAESAAQSLRKTADRADDVVAQARHAKKVGEETATSMAARCGNTGNCFVAGTWVLVAHAPAELPRLADTVGSHNIWWGMHLDHRHRGPRPAAGGGSDGALAGRPPGSTPATAFCSQPKVTPPAAPWT